MRQYKSPATLPFLMAISKPSKSARKREHLALQELGEKLVDLTESQLQSLSLDPSLLEAVQDAKSMRARGAFRRQKQLIGKLMRNQDPEPLRTALDAFGRRDRINTANFHRAEQWRNRITAEGNGALPEFFALTGTENAELSTVVGQLDAAHNDKTRVTLSRKIFRLVHHDLSIRVQKDTD